MAIYFPNQVPSTGQKAGESFASGIGNVLNTLAQKKLSHVQQRQEQGRIGDVLSKLGLPAEYASLPEPYLKEIVKDQVLRYGTNPQGLSAQQGQQQGPEVGQQPGQPQTPQTAQQQETLPSRRMTPQMEQQERHFQQNLGFKKGEVRRKYVDEMVKEKKGVADRRQAIKVMKKLNDDPSALDSPLYLSALKKFGLDNIGDLLKPGTQEFKAAEVSFFSNLKTLFGARPTDFDVKAYLAKLPSLMQSPEGRRRVINNWDNLLEASEIRYNVTRDLLKQYPHGLPEDISIMIEDKAAPLIEHALKKFEDEANAIISGKSSFQSGQAITKDQLSSLPAGTILEENGKKFRWDGSKKKAL